MSLGITARSFQRSKPGVAATIDGRPIFEPQGNVWYVDANVTGGDGKSLTTAFSTMQAAFNALASGDTIYFRGKIREQLVTPANVFDVSVIGLGNRPHHADSTPNGGQKAANTWAAPASPVAGQALVRVIQQGWRFENILFAGAAGIASINFVRNADAGDLERDASHGIVRGCRFAGVASTDFGIKFGGTSFTEIVNNTMIEDNDFVSCATAIGLHSANLATVAKVIGNRFQTCTNDIVGVGYACRIIGNVMSLAPTKCINFTGETGNNQVHGNYLPGTYANGTLYAPATGDNWNGNYASTGVTAAVPA